MSAPKTDIDLYRAGTPNGHKVNILLEELDLNYTVHKIDLSKNQQKEDWFLKINPNGRIPAMLDKTGGANRRIFEGGAMLLYVTEKYDKSNKMSFVYDSDDYWEAMSWLIWMQSANNIVPILELTTASPGLGPMQGQANHFHRYAPEKIEYGINRYQTETKRLYQTLEDHLGQQEAAGKGLWTVGGRYTIADLACFSWINWAEWAGIDTSPFPNLIRWMDEINKRPATQKGLNIPDEFHMKKALANKDSEKDYAQENANWIMKNQQADQSKHK